MHDTDVDGEEKDMKIEALALSRENQYFCTCRRGERKGDLFSLSQFTLSL